MLLVRVLGNNQFYTVTAIDYASGVLLCDGGSLNSLFFLTHAICTAAAGNIIASTFFYQIGSRLLTPYDKQGI